MIEKVLKILLEKDLHDKIHTLKLINLIDILYCKHFVLINWVYPYFLNETIMGYSYNNEEKIKLLAFFAEHSLISIQNIHYFLNVSSDCDVLLVHYYSNDIKSPIMKNEIMCIQMLLQRLFKQSFDFNSIGWKLEVIKFMVICIFKHFNLKEFENEIKEMIESLLEYDDPIIIDSISIILAHLSGLHLEYETLKKN